MDTVSNQEALFILKEHKKFALFLENLDLKRYDSLTLEKAFYFISTGVLVKGMELKDVYQLMDEIRSWVSDNSHGGKRNGAGRPKKNEDIKKVTLSASAKLVESVKKKAKQKGSSLQAEFRKWLLEMNNN